MLDVVYGRSALLDSGSPSGRAFPMSSAVTVADYWEIWTGAPWSSTQVVRTNGLDAVDVKACAAALGAATDVLKRENHPKKLSQENSDRQATVALGFLLLIGAALIAGGFGFHFPKGYIYAAMAFSGAVEGLDMLARRRRKQPPK